MPMLLLIGVVVVLFGALLLFLQSGSKVDKKTGWYAVILVLVSLATGALLGLLHQRTQTPVSLVFLINLAALLLVGVVHTKGMYTLMWARRDALQWRKDSLGKETGFTVGLSVLMALGSMAALGLLMRQWDVIFTMWGLLLAFPLPFLLLKASDGLGQIPRRDFDRKWFYETFPFDETGWKREHLLAVGFIVADSLANENRWFSTKARFSIVIPRDQELRLIYRLALREYHEKNPSVPVQELGYEENTRQFWWLFYVRFVLWKPRTWWRQFRYLNPNETIANNHIRNGDFITAKRIRV